jgi:hypothetical protein
MHLLNGSNPFLQQIHELYLTGGKQGTHCGGRGAKSGEAGTAGVGKASLLKQLYLIPDRDSAADSL